MKATTTPDFDIELLDAGFWFVPRGRVGVGVVFFGSEVGNVGDCWRMRLFSSGLMCK